jgi:hypothetical protein
MKAPFVTGGALGERALPFYRATAALMWFVLAP